MSHSKWYAYQYVQHSIWASHHDLNTLYVKVSFCQINQCMEIANGYTKKLKQTAKHYFFLLRMSVNPCERMTKSEFCLHYIHHIVVSKTTLVCTASYNANKTHNYHIDNFIPVRKQNKLQQYQENRAFFSIQDAVSLLVKQSKKDKI